MAASINGTQIQSTAQSLAAYLQALQAKNDGTNTNIAGQNSGGDSGTASTVVNGTGQATKNTATAKGQAEQVSGQPLDVVNLSAEAQRLLANAQSPTDNSGGLASYLNNNNSTATPADPFGAGYVGAIARFRQWLAQPLGQPIPTPIGQVNTDNIAKSATSGDQTTSSGTPAVNSTST
jgi:hypothetical protein